MNSNTKIHPSDLNYNAALRDAVMDMAPFYDPNHRCGIVRDKIFHGCLEELREREKLTSMKLDEAAKIIRHLLSYADKTAENHPNAVTSAGQNARVLAGIWLAQHERETHKSND